MPSSYSPYLLSIGTVQSLINNIRMAGLGVVWGWFGGLGREKEKGKGKGKGGRGRVGVGVGVGVGVSSELVPETFTFQSLSTSKLEHFKSLCIIRLPCRYAIPLPE
jgi:hypothetical protein